MADLEARVLALERRLAELEAIESIRVLKAHYGELADRRYAGGHPAPVAELEKLGREIAELFTEDAVWDGGKALGVCRGRDAIARRLAEPTLEFAWHFFVKPRIHVDLASETASASWDVLSPCTTRDGRPHWLTGVEHDEYRLVEGRWLHSAMRLDVVFMAPHERGWVRRRPDTAKPDAGPA